MSLDPSDAARRGQAFSRHPAHYGGLQCISVGLALETLSVYSIHRQQSGWNWHSWALHGDDGQIYHGLASGSEFRPLLTLPGATKPDGPPRFGAGDVVGCGLVDLGSNRRGNGGAQDNEATFQGIFFTLNAVFLGIAFLLRSTLEERVPLRPCVGVDAHWLLEFNFGSRPFAFDIDEFDLGQVKAGLQRCAKTQLVAASSRIEEEDLRPVGIIRRSRSSSESGSDSSSDSSDSRNVITSSNSSSSSS